MTEPRPTPAEEIEAALRAAPWKHDPRCIQIGWHHDTEIHPHIYCHPEPDYPAMAERVHALVAGAYKDWKPPMSEAELRFFGTEFVPREEYTRLAAQVTALREALELCERRALTELECCRGVKAQGKADDAVSVAQAVYDSICKIRTAALAGEPS